MWFTITWKLTALILVIGIAIELVSFGFDLFNAVSDVGVLLGTLVVVLTPIAALGLSASILGLWRLKNMKMFKNLFGALLIAMVGLGAVGCTRINPGHVGIKVVNGGSDRGVQDFPTQIGWVTYNPFSTSIFEYPTFVQSAVWTKDPGEGHPANEEITFTNKDKMTISVDVNISYHLEATRVPAFYVKFRSDDLSGFTYGYLHNVARDVFNDHGGKYSIDQIMGDNSAFLTDVRKTLSDEVAALGVVIDQFGLIGAPRPPQNVLDQINATNHASQLTLQKQNELAQVEADMRKETAKKQNYAQNILLVAEAEAKANRMLSESYTTNLLEKIRLEKWDGKLPTYNGSVNAFASLGK